MNELEKLIQEGKEGYAQQLKYLIAKGDSIIEFAVTPLFLSEFQLNDIDKKRIEKIVQKMQSYITELNTELEKVTAPNG